MEFFEVINRRRSVRSYTGEPLTEDQLKAILNAAYASPVAMGRFEDMHLTVIRDQALLGAISQNAREMSGRDGDPLYGAPVLILISVKPGGDAPQNNEFSSAAMIAHNMALAATALGLGSCDIWGAIRLAQQNSALIERLGLPKGFVPVCSLVVGPTDEAMPIRNVPDGKIATSYR